MKLYCLYPLPSKQAVEGSSLDCARDDKLHLCDCEGFWFEPCRGHYATLQCYRFDYWRYTIPIYSLCLLSCYGRRIHNPEVVFVSHFDLAQDDTSSLPLFSGG